MRDDDQGRRAIDQLRAEHRRLHGVLRHLRNSLVNAVGPDESPSFTEVVRLLTSVRDELSRHFAQEEAGGCLDEAVSHCPTLSTEVGRMRAEHPELLMAVDRLIARARKMTPSPVNQCELQREFEDLLHRIRAHEKAESELLSQGFGTNFADQPDATSKLIHDF